MDRVGASLDRTIETLKHRLAANAVAIQLPLGSESSFRGVLDLMHERALIYSDSDSMVPEEGPVPEEEQDRFTQYRESMIEKIVETDESLMIKYLEGEELATEDLCGALRRATLSRGLIPVVVGSALRGIGVDPLLDAITDYLPAPSDVPPVQVTLDDEEVYLEPDEDGPLAALAFKVMADPFVGRLVYLRVYSGTLKAGATVVNSTKDKRERTGRVLTVHANRREEVDGVGAGNICGAIGLKNTFTGDTIAGINKPVVLEPPRFPEPVLSVAIEPATRADQEKLDDALRKLSEEDPTFAVSYNKETGQALIAGMGELHLSVLVDRMKREFGVEANVGKPRVSYREAITVPVRSEGRFVRQTGGHGQYGHVLLDLEPRERGEGFLFQNKITGGVIPREYIPAVEAGVREAVSNGPLAGFPVIDLKVTLVDGSYHDVDSSELAFKAAGSIAIREGVRKAKPMLLEPIMVGEIVTPGDFLGDVIGHLGTMRGQITNIEGQAGTQVVRALIPLSETFGYTTALRSMTQGRATHTLEFQSYEPIPDDLRQGIIHGGRR
jgi:elongation factor G